jgi:hypothetical protein
MARSAFKTFIPLSVENGARSAIIFDFFDLLSAVAAHGKTNGFGGRKLSRMASWWAFEHKDTGNGFEGGYKSWLNAADATSHLFYAYLRSLGPEQTQGGISMLPLSLQKLLQESEYPPQRPSLMQSTTNKVVMIVETVSPTPFALLRRANHFQYRDSDRALVEFSEFEDPVEALTEECRRVLRAISAANQSQALSSAKHSTSLKDASWSRFEDMGFSSPLEEDEDEATRNGGADRRPQQLQGLQRTPASGGYGLARPTTPSWADFLSSGFVDDQPSSPSNLLLPPNKMLPPIETAVRQRSSQSHRPRLEHEGQLEPGELASINRFDLDECFWWVWMSSLAPEETPDRKAAFGRCAVIETVIRTGRWIVVEEIVKGAAPEPEAGAYLAEKKSFFSWTRRNKDKGIQRRKSTGKDALSRNNDTLKASNTMGFSKTSIGPDQQAKIQAAAQQLQLRQQRERDQKERENTRVVLERRGRSESDMIAEKTNSVMTLQPLIVNEASPAMKWASKYDKEAIRAQYLGDTSLGRGPSQTTLPHLPTNGFTNKANDSTANGFNNPPDVPAKASSPPTPMAEPSPMIQPAPGPQSPESPNGVPLTEKAVEAPRDAHPVTRKEIPPRRNGASIPPAPPSKEIPAAATPEPAREVVSAEPKVSAEGKTSADAKRQQGKKLHKHNRETSQDMQREKERERELQREREREEKAAKQNEKESSGGGLKKLFGRKNRASKLPENAASGVNAMLAKDKAKAAAAPPQRAAPPEPVKEQLEEPTRNESSAPVTAADEVHKPEPTLAAPPPPPTIVTEPEAMAEPTYELNDADDGSRINTADANEAKHEFSRFDQGPLSDQPAFVPDEGDDDVDDAVPPPIARHPSNSPLHSPQPPAAEPPKPVPVQDRWAQIRKNAAERAAAGASMTDLTKQSSTPSKADEGGDDTSGEESEYFKYHSTS